MKHIFSSLAKLNKSLSLAEKILYACVFAASAVSAALMCQTRPFYFHRPSVVLLILVDIVFFVTVLADKSRRKTWQFRFGCIAAIWYLVTHLLHFADPAVNPDIRFLLCQFLLAFPFVSVLKDENRQFGLKFHSIAVIITCTTLCFFVFLLEMGRLPESLSSQLYFNLELRLCALRYPTTCAPYFMLAIIFAVAFTHRKDVPLGIKILLLAAAAMNFICLSLTNARTSVFAVGCMLAGDVLYLIWNHKGVTRFLLGGLAAVCVLLVSYSAAHQAYLLNSRLYSHPAAIEPSASAENTSVESPFAAVAAPVSDENTPAVFLLSAVETLVPDENISSESNLAANKTTQKPAPRSYENNKTLNARTLIWADVFDWVNAHPMTYLIGAEAKQIILPYGEHSHNALIEIFLRTGLPGLLMALVYTIIIFRNALIVFFTSRDHWKCTIALIPLGLFIVSVMEPLIFCCEYYFFPTSMAMMLCGGYLTAWARKTPSDDTQ